MGGTRPPNARLRKARRTGRCSSRAEVARTVVEHVAVEEFDGRGSWGGSAGAGESRSWHEAGGEGGRPRTRPLQRTSIRTTPRPREEGRRDCAPLTRLHLRPREARLCERGRQTAVWDPLAHDATMAGEKRVCVAGRDSAQLSTVGTLSSTGRGRTDDRRVRCRGGACEARGGRKEWGLVGRGRGRGMGGEETLLFADGTRSRPPCPLSRSDLAAPIA